MLLLFQGHITIHIKNRKCDNDADNKDLAAARRSPNTVIHLNGSPSNVDHRRHEDNQARSVCNVARTKCITMSMAPRTMKAGYLSVTML